MNRTNTQAHETTDGKAYQDPEAGERHQAYLDLAGLIEAEGWPRDDARKLARILVAKADALLPMLHAARPPVDEAPTS